METDDQIAFHRKEDVKRFVNRLQNPYIAARERLLARCLANLAPEKGGSQILEIGCGEGNNLAYLREALPDAWITGLDFSQAKVHFLAKSFVEPSTVCGDATRLPFASASFNFVLLRDLLHHVNWARTETVEEALRVLRPGGVLAVVEPNPDTLIQCLFRFLVPAERGMKDSRPRQLIDLLSSYGKVTVVPLEASYLLRAFGYVLAWPKGYLRHAYAILYNLADRWERIVATYKSSSHWACFLYWVKKKA